MFATHGVLVRVHVHFEAVIFAFAYYAHDIVHELVVMFPTGDR